MRRLYILLTFLLAATLAPCEAKPFIHPGALNTQPELDFVASMIKKGFQPWSGKFNEVKGIATGNGGDQKANGRKAYAAALAWHYTGEESYAKQAIGVLNGWNSGFPVDNGQYQLQCAWIGALLGPAAELMLTYPGWAAADIAKVRAMFKNTFYPPLNKMSLWNGNVDLTQISAMLSIAVFMEDTTEFNLAITRLNKRNPAYFYLDSDRAQSRLYGGSSDNAWADANGNAPTAWVNGLTQETCRDNDHHAQYAMSAAFEAAEIAWHQGVDIYTPNQARYTAVLELMATQITTGKMQGTCQNNNTTADRFDTWEIGYNHYHNRKGIDLPNTLKAINQEIRPKGQSDWNIFYESLTHVDLPTSTLAVADRPSGFGKVSLTRNGTCEILSNATGSVDVSVVSLNGKRISQSSVSVTAGEARSVSLGLGNASAGIYLVQIRSTEGMTVLKYSK